MQAILPFIFGQIFPITAVTGDSRGNRYRVILYYYTIQSLQTSGVTMPRQLWTMPWLLWFLHSVAYRPESGGLFSKLLGSPHKKKISCNNLGVKVISHKAPPPNYHKCLPPPPHGRSERMQRCFCRVKQSNILDLLKIYPENSWFKRMKNLASCIAY